VKLAAWWPKLLICDNVIIAINDVLKSVLVILSYLKDIQNEKNQFEKKKRIFYNFCEVGGLAAERPYGLNFLML
jgi:hypothetical protein